MYKTRSDIAIGNGAVESDADPGDDSGRGF